MITCRNRFAVVLTAGVLAASFGLAGCSSKTAPAPNPTAASGSTDLPTSRAEAQTPMASTSVGSQPAPSGSSLEALQRGESPATAASSPLKDVYFDYDRYDLRDDARETLKANAAWLKANRAAQIQIEGHCDERGTTEYNLALGSKRAQSVKDYLVTLGISADRLSTISYGEEVPVCREQAEQCWQQNRRARFVVQPPRPAV